MSVLGQVMLVPYLRAYLLHYFFYNSKTKCVDKKTKKIYYAKTDNLNR